MLSFISIQPKIVISRYLGEDSSESQGDIHMNFRRWVYFASTQDPPSRHRNSGQVSGTQKHMMVQCTRPTVISRAMRPNGPQNEVYLMLTISTITCNGDQGAQDTFLRYAPKSQRQDVGSASLKAFTFWEIHNSWILVLTVCYPILRSAVLRRA